MNYKACLIRLLTNMHVGGGDSNFGVVDKLVQRDPVTNYPTVFSSSLKGALKEYCNGESFVSDVFGDNDNAGNYRFFAANLLALPARSNKKSFFMATAPSVLKEFMGTLTTFGIGNGFDDIQKLAKKPVDKGKVFVNHSEPMRIEDWGSIHDAEIPTSNPLLGNNIALFHEDDFKELANNLPVIARNHLENGQSTNLWYEEIVPRESRFYFILGFGESNHDEFETKIRKGIVQIGGNASIGYGFTKIEKIVQEIDHE
ncbi:type III-B CRISPR module RAMP protein Cmr4 [candidate division KSB1 bacterium]|nr:type III-B CRISPR module RAMP protein Cmr4 [candidate division KSB1 bacterium]